MSEDVELAFTGLKGEDPGQIGPYRIMALLGEGGMGRVYLGLSRGGRSVAVKVVRPELTDDREFRRRFAREVDAARRVNGLFTAGVVDADPHGTPAWMATAYIPGVSLADAVNEYGALPWESVAALGAGLAEALEAIHTAGLVHRDLKPSNVLLAEDGPRVIDFGISVASEATVLTRTGLVVGTPGFMSPEQLTDRRVSPASDVFSLGTVLAFAACGAGPFGTGSVQGLLFRIVFEEPHLEGIPGALREVLARCLAKEPDQRPCVPEVLEELAGLAARQGGSPGGGVGWLPGPLAHAVRLRTDHPTPATAPAVAAPSVEDKVEPAPPTVRPGSERTPTVSARPGPPYVPADPAGNVRTARGDISHALTQTAVADGPPGPALPSPPEDPELTEKPGSPTGSPAAPGVSRDERHRPTRRTMLLSVAAAVGAVGLPAGIYLTRSASNNPSRTGQSSATPSRSARPTSAPPRPARRISVGSAVNTLAFSPDGKVLAGGCDDGAIRLWSTATGKLSATLKAEEPNGDDGTDVLAVAFSPDGRTLAGARDSGTLQLWDPATGDLTASNDEPGDSFHTLVFSPDGRNLAGVDSAGTLSLRHLPAGRDHIRYSGVAVSVAFSPDGKTLAVGGRSSNPGRARLWSTATGKLTATLEGATFGVNSVAFSPDGRVLAGGSGDDTVALWDPATGELTATLAGENVDDGEAQSVDEVRFSADGTVLVTCGYPNTIRQWHPATGKLKATSKAPAYRMYNWAFSPDGSVLAGTDLDNTVWLWQL
ncbi:WD40 repeat domain-containing serine/threonine protein kinase [Streptomyces sp. CLCI03]